MPFSFDPQPEENEIECGRCGALIYDQLSRCPNCGVNLYEPEADQDMEMVEGNQQSGIAQKVKMFFRRLTGKPYSAEEVFGASLDQAQYYSDLLLKVGGDSEVVERLIEFEMRQEPTGTRISWLKNAILRWEKDNRTPFNQESK